MDSSKSAEAEAQRATAQRTAQRLPQRARKGPAQQPALVASTPPPEKGSQVAADGHLHVCAVFEVDDEKCRIVCMDAPGLNGSAARLTTRANGSPASDEVARFEVEGLRYVLLMPATPRAQRAARREAESAARASFLKLLTQRELQIVRLACTGCLNQQIAERLGISEHTVGSHLKNVYVKLGLRTRADLLFRCARALARAQGNGT